MGTGIHYALEVRYPVGRKRGPLPQNTWLKWYDEQPEQFDQWDEEGNRIPARDLGAIMCEEYVREYGNDDHVEIIQPEAPMEIDVYDKDGNYLVTWVGRSDAIYRDLSRATKRRDVVGLFEHKTAKSIEEELSVISGYGEQGLSYWWAADQWLHHNDVLKEGTHLDHVLFNWLRKGIPDERPQNEKGQRLNKPTKDALLAALTGVTIPPRSKVEDLMNMLRGMGQDPLQLGEVSKTQPSILFHRYPLPFGAGEMASINRRIRAEAQEMALVRAHKLPIYKNPTRDCKWECSFKDVCEVHEMGGDWQDLLALEFTRWDPYEGHELEQERL